MRITRAWGGFVGALVLGALAGSAWGQAGVPYRPLDLPLGPMGSPQRLWTDHGLFASLGARCVFVAEGVWGIGRELWVTDGTPSGTRLLKDLDPRSGRDLGLLAVQEFVDGGTRKAAFLGSNEVGSVVVETDGTSEGTTVSEASGARALLFVGTFGGRPLFFSWPPLSNDWALWIAGPSGNRLLGRWPRISSLPPTPVGEVGGRSYWLQAVPEGTALFTSDGTPDGTGRVAGIPASTAGARAAIAAGRVFMFTYQAASGARIFSTAGTPETTAPVTLPPGVSLPSTSAIAPLPDRTGVLFSGTPSVLIHSDGTEAGTSVFLPGLTVEVSGSDLPAVIDTPVGPVTLMRGLTGGGQHGLWVTDGSPEGTVALATGSSSWTLLGASGGRAWVGAGDLHESLDVRRTDGTAAGTVRVSNDRRKAWWNGTGFGIEGPYSAAAGGKLILDPVLSSLPWDQQGDLLTFDAATNERTLLDPGPGLPLPEGTGVSSPVVIGDRTLLAVSNARAGTSRLLVSDGTAAGTGPLVEVTFPTLSPPTRIGNLAWFSFTNARGDRELWRTDGTADGTFAVGTAPAAPSGGFGPILAGGDGVVFLSRGVYTASPAQGSIHRLSGPADARDGDLGVDAQGRVYFSRVASGFRVLMIDPAVGVETTLTVLPPASAPYTLNFQPVGDRICFNDASQFRRLWRSDGTPAGTQDLSATASLSDPPRASAGGTLLFSREGAGVTDLVAVSPSGALTPIRAFTAIAAMTTFHDRVVMLADDGVHGLEPWISDGTPEGTSLITETVPGPRGAVFGPAGGVRDGTTRSSPTVTAGDRACYFSIATDDLAAHAWRTDGTPEGTRPMAEPPDALGQLPLGPRDFAESPGAVWFRGWTATRGVDLFAVRVCEGDFNTDGFLDFFDFLGFLTAFEAGTPDADFNGDAFLDFFDYDAFVGAFERGC